MAWAAGINLYAAIATLGILGITGNMTLPPDLEVLANPLVIGAQTRDCIEKLRAKLAGRTGVEDRCGGR